MSDLIGIDRGVVLRANSRVDSTMFVRELLCNKRLIHKINETLEYMEDRLEELRGVKEELDAYWGLDRDRRVVEYTLYDKELRRARERLDEVEHSRNDEADRLGALHEEVRDMHDRILAVQAYEKTRRNALKRNTVYVKSLERDKTAAVTHRTKLDLACRDLDKQLVQGKETLASNRVELAKLNGEIAEVERDLGETVQPAFDDAKTAATGMADERDEARRRMEGLYAKQGRGKQFRTKKERDAHLRPQVRELASARAEKEELLHERRSNLSGMRGSFAAEEKEAASKKKELGEKPKLLEDLKRTVDERKRVRAEMADSRKEQWRAINEIADRVGDANKASRKALYDMRKSMPRATSQGLDALKKIVASEGLADDADPR